MKNKTQEKIQFWAIAIILFCILMMMLFNMNEPKKFICLEDGKLIDTTNAYTLRELFDVCTYECDNKDYSCLKLCTEMISDIVNKLEED